MTKKSGNRRDQLTTGQKRKISRLRKDLVRWYQVHGRDLPWRRDAAKEYENICVEVLLQRTRAEVVATIYNSFFRRYPTWNSLAGSELSELEEVLRPLGLWRRRAQSIKSLATYAVEHDGVFPSVESELRGVPAVGQYVGNAILMFQHGQARPLVDVNMARVLERFVRPRRLADIRHDPWLQAAGQWLVQTGDPREVNWAVLDFAALVCRARQPTCLECPVKARCKQGAGVISGRAGET